jgi:predicted DNA-binding transcriptional regulator AlpA
MHPLRIITVAKWIDRLHIRQVALWGGRHSRRQRCAECLVKSQQETSVSAAQPNVPRFLNVKQLAPILGISVSVLNKMRCDGSGPPFRKFGPRIVRYVLDEALTWAAEQAKGSTADKSPSEERWPARKRA